MQSKKVNKIIKVAKKYKINRPSMLEEVQYTPYAEVTYIHGDKEEVAEFPQDRDVFKVMDKILEYVRRSIIAREDKKHRND